MKTAKHLSKTSAIETVKRIFANTPDDVISVRDLYIAWGRDLSKENSNKIWLQNKIVELKYNNLVKSLYAMRNNRKILDKIQLTLEGKMALGRIEEAHSNQSLQPTKQTNSEIGKIKLADVIREIPRIKIEEKDNFKITFDVSLISG